MRISLFSGIKNYMPHSMKMYHEELLHKLKKFNILTINDCLSDFRNTFILKGIFNRYLFYTLKAINNTSKINHILDHSNAFLVNVFPKNSRNVVTCHDIVPLIFNNNYPFRIFGIRGLKKANKIITISKNTKDDLVKYLKIKEDKISIINLGVNHSLFKYIDKVKAKKELGLEYEKIILNVSSEEKRKNIPALLKSFSKIRSENTLLIRIGKMSNISKRIIEKLEIKNVKYISNIPYDTLPLYYNAADLFVYPSLYEGFGLPPLEAMSCGCPVITSNTSSLPEVVGNAGIMIDPNDLNALAHAMEKVLTNEGLREDMIKKGLEQAKKFSWEKCAEETLKVYDEIS